MERSQSFSNFNQSRLATTITKSTLDREQSASTSNIFKLSTKNEHHLNSTSSFSSSSPTSSMGRASFNRFKKHPVHFQADQSLLPTSRTNSSTGARRKRLQRQKSTIVCHRNSSDEIDYAADLDEADDELDGEKVERTFAQLKDADHMTLLKRVLMTNPLSKKQVRFCYRQQSEGILSEMKSPLQEPDVTSTTTHPSQQLLLSSTSSSLALSSSINTANPNDYKRSSSTSSTNITFERNNSTSSNDHHPRKLLKQRGESMYSTDSSRYSSVDSLLESRKPDPEAILINLGFGPIDSEDILSRIPKRFLKPSQVRGIDTDAFIKRLQLASTIADHSVLGYRGLTGNPDVPPSHIVAKIMQRFEVNERKKSLSSMELKLR